MLYNEFKERTGLEVTEEEFNHINAIYMSCGEEISNPEFCHSYPAVHNNPIVENLYKELEKKERELLEMDLRFHMLEKAYFKFVSDYESNEYRKLAVQAYRSELEYVKALLRHGCDLGSADKDYIINEL